MVAAIRRMFPRSLLFQLVLAGAVLTVVSLASAGVKRVKSQTVYVPAYSHIYHGDREVPFYLTVTLSTATQQGVSFSSRGQAIEEDGE